MGGARLRVVVAGAGITGLVATDALLRAGAEVTLIERSTRLGGKIGTNRRSGFLAEWGADSFLAVRPAGLELCRDLGLAGDIVPPLAPGGTFIWYGDGLVPVPEGTGLGIPTRFGPFIRSPLFSPLEKLRAALEAVVPPDAAAGDTSIGAFLRRRFGDAVVDRLAGPLVSAVYGAAADELSLDALMPRLRDAVRDHGSLVRAGFAAQRAGRGPAAPPLVALRGGMGALIDALAVRVRSATLRLGTDVLRVDRAGRHYAVHLGDGSRINAEAVILATPATVTARVLDGLVPGVASALTSIAYRSTAAVSLGYDERQLRTPLEGHGFVVPEGALAIDACTWSSAKWPCRAPAGAVLVRATIRAEHLFRGSDDDLIDAAHAALVRAMKVVGRPAFAHVSRWEGAMPRYTVGHAARVARVDAALATFAGIAVAGAAYRGTGIPECVQQARAAVEAVRARVDDARSAPTAYALP